MNYWKLRLVKKSIINKALFLLLLFINTEVFAKEFIIEGNEYTDKDIVISIIDKIPEIDIESQANYIFHLFLFPIIHDNL